MRIGIDMLGIQSAGGVGRDSSRLGRRLVSSLLALRSEHHFVLYSREVIPDHQNHHCSMGEGTIPEIIEHNPDNLDWLVLLDPFSCVERGIAPRARLDGVKVASVITNLAPGRLEDRRLAPLRSYDAILTFSEEAKAECLERLSTSANRVVCLGLGVDHLWIDGDSVELEAEQLQLLEIDGPFLFANLDAGQDDSNLTGILDAYRRLPTHLRDSHSLVIAGEVVDPWAALRFLQDHDCAEGLILLGRVEESTLRLLFGRCAAFVSPSFARASALSIVEAMGRGAAIVAGRAGSQSVVLDGAGLLADPSNPAEIADQIIAFLSDDERKQSFQRKAVNQARKLPWDSVVQRFLSSLENESDAQVISWDRRDSIAGLDDWNREYMPDDPSHLARLDSVENEMYDDGSFGDMSWEDVTIHVLADIFSVRSRLQELERQPGLVLLRDESSLDRIQFGTWKMTPETDDVEAEVACSRLLEIFSTCSRVAVRSSRNLGAIRSRFPEYSDRVVLIPPRSSLLPREREWSASSSRNSDDVETQSVVSPLPRKALIARQEEVPVSSSFSRMPGLTPLPLDV